MTTLTTSAAAAAMHEWARGSYPCEAGVELLIRSNLAARIAQVPPWAPGAGFDPAVVADVIEHAACPGASGASPPSPCL